MLKQEGLHNEAQQQTQAGGYLDDAGNYIPFSDATSGIKERYSFTDDDDDVQLDQLAWYRSNSNGMAHPVGKKAANAFGLYDMHGNAQEWVEDTYHDSYEGTSTDGSPWVDGDASRRVIRGNSRRMSAASCRTIGEGEALIRDEAQIPDRAKKGRAIKLRGTWLPGTSGVQDWNRQKKRQIKLRVERCRRIIVVTR